MPNPEARIRRRIEESGAISFAEFMEKALYGGSSPRSAGGGYYNSDPPRIGRKGDFITGSSFSSLFGRTTARLLRRMDAQLSGPADFFEAGYGTGAHLESLVGALGEGDHRRLSAWDRVQWPLPLGVEPLENLDELATGEVNGLIFSYELFDALPVHRVIGRADGSLGELWVTLDEDGAFTWSEGDLSDARLAELWPSTGVELEAGQVADVSLDWAPLYRALAQRLGRGLLVTVDYGYESERLYDVRVRQAGTLACYREHRVHRNPFVHVGAQDLSAHVDFWLLRQAGEEAGLQTVAFTRQALWLTACGMFDDLQTADRSVRQEAAELLNPEGMGAELRVLVQAREMEAAELFDMQVLFS